MCRCWCQGRHAPCQAPRFAGRKTRPSGPPGPKEAVLQVVCQGVLWAKCRFLHELFSGDATRHREAKAKATAQANNTVQKSDERVYPLFEVSPGVSEVPVPSGKADASFATAVKEPGAHHKYWPGALSRLSVDQKQKVASPTPGYNAQTLLKCCGVEGVALLDYGATCGSIPEWLFAEIYENTMAQLHAGKCKWGDRKCPIREIGDFSADPQSMLGFKKGTTVVTQYYVVLRMEFQGLGQPKPEVAAVKLQLKVMPADSAGFPGVVLDFPTLGPRGLQHRVTQAGHMFDRLSVTLPRLELRREAELNDSTAYQMKAPLQAVLRTRLRWRRIRRLLCRWLGLRGRLASACVRLLVKGRTAAAPRLAVEAKGLERLLYGQAVPLVRYV